MTSSKGLFLTFLKLGFSSFGGGMAMVSVIEKEIVEHKKWITKEEFVNCLILAQSIPGTIVINLATSIGYKKLGLKGAITSMLGAILPSIVSIIVVSTILLGVGESTTVINGLSGVRVIAPLLISLTVISLFKSLNKTKFSIAIFVVMFLLLQVGLDPILTIVFGIIIGILKAKLNSKIKI